MGSVTQGSVRSDGAGRTRMWCSRSHPSLPPSPPAPPCLPLSLPKRPLPSLCSPSPPAAHRPCSPSPMPPSLSCRPTPPPLCQTSASPPASNALTSSTAAPCSPPPCLSLLTPSSPSSLNLPLPCLPSLPPSLASSSSSAYRAANAPAWPANCCPADPPSALHSNAAPPPLPAIPPPRPRLVVVFSGQGGQWPGMARELLACEPVFRAELQRCSSLLAHLVPWSPLDLLNSEHDASLLEHTSYAQPLLVCLQVALTALWRSWGLSPTAVLGHSVGEIAAAHVAGILSLEQALLLAVRRGQLMEQTHGQGAMLAVGLAPSRLSQFLGDLLPQLDLAAL